MMLYKTELKMKQMFFKIVTWASQVKDDTVYGTMQKARLNVCLFILWGLL